MIPFLKMHGLGNDFVILDTRTLSAPLSENLNEYPLISSLSDRRIGIGCDQFITLGHSTCADIRMTIYNADGGRVGACGNATRCVGRLIMTETHRAEALIETDTGILLARSVPESESLITVNMGRPRTDWRDIPLSQPCDTLNLPITQGPLTDPVAVNMGNPHLIFFVPDPQAIDLDTYGPGLMRHPFFPEQTNVSIASVPHRHAIRMRVWERGVGLTRACGSGACAAAVAGIRRRYIESPVTVTLDGGDLEIIWDPDDTIWMTGQTAVVFEGQINLSQWIE